MQELPLALTFDAKLAAVVLAALVAVSATLATATARRLR